MTIAQALRAGKSRPSAKAGANPNLTRQVPTISYRGPGPGGWRRADPETDTFPQEEADDIARGFLWSVRGKNLKLTVLANGVPKEPRYLDACPADLSSTQERKGAGWMDVYVDEVTSETSDS